MTAILSEPVDQITAADIKSLVTSRVPEGERMEFKRELPAKGTSGGDPWMTDQKKIGRYAKAQILKEVVSFANAYGGVLVLGIEEDGDATPPVAKAIRAIPECEELAERFRMIFRDRVEPKLPSYEIFAVVTGESDDGVVVFRVPGGSRLAPHRIKGTWICPVRRWDRSEEMSMREIQDMTLNVSRGLERLDEKLRRRAARFEDEFGRLTSPESAYGIRITALPVGDDIRLTTICRPQLKLAEGLITPNVTVTRQLPDRAPTTVDGVKDHHQVGHTLWNPQLRSARSRPLYEDLPDFTYFGYLELHCDGLVEFGWLSVIEGSNRQILYSDYPVRELANVICWADTLRRYADAGSAEYAVEVAIHVKAEKVFVLPRANCSWGASALRLGNFAGELSRGVTPMPRYPLDDVAEAAALLSTFEHDLCNAAGKAFADDTLGKFEIAYEQG